MNDASDERLRSLENPPRIGLGFLGSAGHVVQNVERMAAIAMRAAPCLATAKARARVEHVFGDQKNGMGAGIVRTIGIIRARCKIGMTNLVYNMRRFVCLERMAAAAA